MFRGSHRLLFLAGFLVGVVLSALPVLAGTGAAPAASRPLHRYEFERPEMGVPFRVVLYAWNPALAKVAATEAFERIRALNGALSDYETDSELSRLSRTAGTDRWVPVSDTLWEVFRSAQDLADRTDGAFDITVGPAVNLWRRARRLQAMPPVEALAAARAAVGHEHLRLDADLQRVRLTMPGMRLDLGGIAKGYALDEAMKVLERRGIERALVSGGGDLRVSGPPPDQAGWRIELAPLDGPDAPPNRFLRLAHRALATSGDLYQHVTIDGVRYSHIVDPRTCLGLTDRGQVTVIAPRAMLADSLSTALSVLGPERGLPLLEDWPGVEAHLARRPHDTVEVVESPGFRAFLEEPADPR